MKTIKIEWCKSWIKHAFEKLPVRNGGIECALFWNMAENAGLWERGIYGSPMSEALTELTKIDTIQDKNGCFLYSVFRLA